MTESKLNISRIGSYTFGIVSEPQDCEQCGNAEWGDVLIEGVCGKCHLANENALRARAEKAEAELAAEREVHRECKYPEESPVEDQRYLLHAIWHDEKILTTARYSTTENHYASWYSADIGFIRDEFVLGYYLLPSAPEADK